MDSSVKSEREMDYLNQQKLIRLKEDFRKNYKKIGMSLAAVSLVAIAATGCSSGKDASPTDSKPNQNQEVATTQTQTPTPSNVEVEAKPDDSDEKNVALTEDDFRQIEERVDHVKSDDLSNHVAVALGKMDDNVPSRDQNIAIAKVDQTPKVDTTQGDVLAFGGNQSTESPDLQTLVFDPPTKDVPVETKPPIQPIERPPVVVIDKPVDKPTGKDKPKDKPTDPPVVVVVEPPVITVTEPTGNTTVVFDPKPVDKPADKPTTGDKPKEDKPA
ncbi:hypothetical protein SAMN04487866_1221, partial [Thermoactinomyces sp. DSM 45891]